MKASTHGRRSHTFNLLVALLYTALLFVGVALQGAHDAEEDGAPAPIAQINRQLVQTSTR